MRNPTAKTVHIGHFIGRIHENMRIGLIKEPVFPDHYDRQGSSPKSHYQDDHFLPLKPVSQPLQVLQAKNQKSCKTCDCDKQTKEYLTVSNPHANSGLLALTGKEEQKRGDRPTNSNHPCHPAGMRLSLPCSPIGIGNRFESNMKVSSPYPFDANTGCA